jgi:hypothetical protein
MRQGEGIAYAALCASGITEARLMEILRRGGGIGLPGSDPRQGLTPRGKRAVELAVEEALATRDTRGRLTVHLLTHEEELPEGNWHRRMEKGHGALSVRLQDVRQHLFYHRKVNFSHKEGYRHEIRTQ